MNNLAGRGGRRGGGPNELTQLKVSPGAAFPVVCDGISLVVDILYCHYILILST